MRRFIMFLILNVAGVGGVGYLQANLFDWDGFRTQVSSFVYRSTGYSPHK